MNAKLTPCDYFVFGVLCAAKFETGPKGGRQAFRIEMRGGFSEADVLASLAILIDRGMVVEEELFPGMVHYSAPLTVSDPELRPGCHVRGPKGFGCYFHRGHASEVGGPRHHSWE